MFILVLVIAIIFIFILISKSPEKIGSAGEAYVDRIIFKNLSDQDYKILSNITLPTYNESTTQIDHIIFSIYGIFVIKLKIIVAGYLGQPIKKLGHKLLEMVKNIIFRIHCFKTKSILEQ
jgi:hypothetical protein